MSGAARLLPEKADGGIVLAGVRAGYGDTVVLENVSLVLTEGATLAVLGRNGVGKTTLLATIMGHTTDVYKRQAPFAGRSLRRCCSASPTPRSNTCCRSSARSSSMR